MQHNQFNPGPYICIFILALALGAAILATLPTLAISQPMLIQLAAQLAP